MKAWVFAGVLTVGLAAALVGVTQAARIAYDGIEYPPGPLAGNGPAFGFAAPWMADPGVAVVAAGLFSPLGLPPAGGAVAGNFDYQRPLLNPQAPLAGKEFWASFLLFHSGPNDQTYMGLSPVGSPLGAPPAVGFGVRLGQYGLFVGGAFTPAAPAFTPAGATDLLVTHFIAGGAVWTVELYVNPTTFAAPDLVMNVAPTVYGMVVNQNQSQFESDEFRLGDTAGDVAAVGVTPTDRTSWGRVKQLYR